MKRIAVLLLGLLSYAAGYSLPSSYRRVCYYASWSENRPEGGKFLPEDIDSTLCTHLVFAFASLDGNQLAPGGSNDDGPNGLYARVTGLKTQNAELSVLLSVGGWNFGTEKFTALLSTPENRAEFVRTAIPYLRTRNFDGLDLDFEFPGSRNSPPEDKQRFTLLVQELRAAFDAETVPSGKQRLLLTAAVSGYKETIDNGYEIRSLVANLDWVNVMTYDFNTAADGKTGLNSPLYAGSSDSGDEALRNTDWAATYWLENGSPAEKLTIGFGTYGRTFHLTDPDQNGVGAASSGPGAAGPFTNEAGFLSYYEICRFVADSNARSVYDSERRAPYAYNGDQWVGYENERSFGEKIEWLKARGFGGVFVWSVDLDDFSGGSCGAGTYPLLKHIKSLL